MSGMCLYIEILNEELVWVTNKWLLVISSVIIQQLYQKAIKYKAIFKLKTILYA